MDFGTIVAKLKLDITPFTDAMKDVRKQTQRFASDMAAATDPKAADKLLGDYTSLNDRLHKVGLGLRDIARISAGIIVSQTFYRTANAIKDATNALWEFNETLDYAQVSYSALFGSTDMATTFLETLKEFSVDTIFEFSDLENMSRKLLAYGIEYKNLMYLVEGLTNIGTLSGDSAALERLAVAIGQINAKGTLKAEEIRQLANAYVPVYDILQEKMGLSKEDLGNIGNLGIPAKDAINAIVEYANEQFGSVADAAMYTITGLNNRIVDSMKVLGSEIIKPITTFYKSLAYFIANQLDTIRDVYAKGGIGGIFEYLVPNEAAQRRIRELFANISNLVSSIAMVFKTLGPYIKQFIGGLVDAFNILLAVINGSISAHSAFVQRLMATTPAVDILTKALITAAAAWALFKLQALAAAVVSGVGAAIVGVAKAVTFLATSIMSNPIIALFVIFGAVLVGLAANANGADNAFSRLLKTLQSYSAGGKTADDMLQVGDAMDKASGSAEDFWNEMGDGAEDTEDAVDKAGKAAKKAASGLLSFDEVFKLNENKASGSGALDGIEDLAGAFEDIGGIGGGLLPEIPDFSQYASQFIDSLFGDMWDALQSIAGGGAVGALIGGLIGFAIGGLAGGSLAAAITGAKWGATIGTIAGAGFAAFWTDTYKELEASLMKIAVGSGIGLLVGGLVGMVIGAFATKTVDGALLGAKYGATIGTLVGTGVGGFWAIATEEMSNAIEAIAVGGATGALIGGLVGFVLGAFSTKTLRGALQAALWGATIGSVVGAGIGTIFADFEGMLETTIGQIAVGSASGMLIGALAGLLIGAFSTRTLAGALTGAKWGATIGTVAGGALAGIFDSFEEELQKQIGAIVGGSAEGALVGGLAGLLIGAFATKTLAGALTGAKYGVMLGTIIGGSVEAIFGDAETTIGERLENMFSHVSAASTGGLIGALIGTIVGAIVGAFAGGIGAIPGAMAGAKLGAVLGTLGGMLYSYLQTSGISESLEQWMNEQWTKATVWLADTGDDIAEWWDGLWDGIEKWFKELGPNIKTWWNNLWIVKAWRTGWASVSEWYTNLKASLSEWFAKLIPAISTWWNNLWYVRAWKSGWSAISEWFSNLWRDISSWFSNLGRSVSSWWDGLWSDKKATVDVGGVTSTVRATNWAGHATGGIFDREHIARFAEGNKAEAVIPLENASAMQPFVNAISDGILQGLAPTLATAGGSTNALPPMYVGTLIADERGIQQLYKKFELYEAKEMARKGLR